MMANTPVQFKGLVRGLERAGLLACPRRKVQNSSSYLIKWLEDRGYIDRCNIALGATSYDGIVDRYNRVSAFDNSSVASNIVGSFFISTDSIESYPGIISTHVPPGTVYNRLTIGLMPTGNPNTFDFLAVAHDTPDSLQVIKTVQAPITDGKWHSIQYSLDLAGGAAQLVVDDVFIPLAPGSDYVTTGSPFTLDLPAVSGWTVGDVFYNGSHVVLLEGCLAEVWLSTVAEIPDFSVAANRRKFITRYGRPADLGANGEKPFGVRPLFYSVKGDGTNLGIGGDLQPVGVPTQCGSNP